MNNRRGLFLTPKLYVFLVLVGFTLIGMVNTKDMHSQAINVSVSVLTAAVFDLVVGLYQKRNQLFPDGAIVTGLIVSLVLSSATPWYICALITLIALLSKHLLKNNRKPLFNPAAFGLLVAIVLFSGMESWWGGLSMLPPWTVVLVIIGGYLVVNRVNKFPLVFAFLGTYFLLLLILGYWHIGNAGDAVRVPFLNSTLFLAFFMLTDPPTSPAKYKDQIMFGIITAVVTALIYATNGWIGYLLCGLLTANVWHFIRSRKALVPKKTVISMRR
jgi:Na+-translocating ferredoxin:NAD+ oxidoreductase RnfD subunit